jgi:hypothetical protein
LRHPRSGGAVKQDELCRLLAAHPDEFSHALTHLIERQIMEPVGNGFRLKVF